MEKIQALISDNPVILYIIGICLFSVVFMVISSRKVKKGKDQFKERFPDASRIFLAQQGFKKSATVKLYEVNGEAVQAGVTGFTKSLEHSQYFSEGTKFGYMVKPGSNIFLVSYETVKHGVIHKNTITYSDPIQVEITCAPNTNYMITFDLDENTFKVEEQ